MTLHVLAQSMLPKCGNLYSDLVSNRHLRENAAWLNVARKWSSIARQCRRLN